VAEPEFKHVFGPVPSRRLGRSLGVDLVPHKTCPYDCLYCQIGRTTVHSVERREFVPLEDVLDEVKRKLAAGAQPDYVTLSGSGEPTLYSRLGELIEGLKPLGVPVALLSNGALLWDEEVAVAAARADRVCPSLDAGRPDSWARVNRPAPGLTFEKMLTGLVAFRDRRGRGPIPSGFRSLSPQLWLEVLLLAGVTDGDEEVRAIAACAARVRPDRVQLGTVVRPPADAEARPVPAERLRRLAGLFDPPAEVIAEFSGPAPGGKPAARSQDVLEMLARRPCTAEDVAAGLRVELAEARRHLNELVSRDALRTAEREGRRYYDVTGRG